MSRYNGRKCAHVQQIKKLTACLLAVVMIVALVPAQAAQSGTALTRGQTADRLLAAADDYNAGVQRSDILKGYPNGDLAEDQGVSRVQALVMLERAFGGLPTPVGDNARSGYPAASFTDVPRWAQEELSSVLASGIVAGTSATTLSPNDPILDWQLDLLIDRVYALEGTNLKDDFYAAVNKTALDQSVIQPGYTSSGGFTDLAIETNQEVAQIITDIVAAPKTDGERKIAALYENILSLSQDDPQALAPVQGYLDAIDKAASPADIAALLGQLQTETGTSLILGVTLGTDAKDSDAHILTVATMAPMLGSNGYDTATAAQKAAYLQYLTTLFTLAGQKDAAQQAQLLWDADTVIAAASLDNQELADVDKTYNLYTMAQLKALFPQIDLEALFAASGFRLTDKIVVSDPGALQAVAALFAADQLDTLKAYARLGIVSSFGPVLDEAFSDAYDVFQQGYLGVSGALTREETAAQYVMSLMSDYLGQAYVDRCFSAQAKADVEQMVRDIIGVYEQRIRALDWMSDATKTMALKKLDTMTYKIGYPDQWDDPYHDVTFRTTSEGGSFYRTIVDMSLASREAQIAAQDQPVDKDAWLITPYTVNAYYDPNANSINFPAAILQAPFYDVDAPAERNLGGIGYVIAHEITHAFDNNGAKYDENGNAADWWTAEDYAAFQGLCEKVVALYDGREVVPGITCSGALTLSEDIADLGAVACITQLESQKAKPDYAALYTAAGQIWCSSYTREYRQLLAQYDVHAPDKLRGSLVLQNFQPFYDAFGITEGDGMWLAPQDRVQIW